MTCSIGFFNNVPIAVLFLTVGLGYLIGKLKVGPIQLGGVCGTLIVALLIGQTGCQMRGDLKEVAFALFIFAMGYSGGPLLATSRPTKLDRPESATAAMSSTAAEPPCAATASKPVVRTVMTLTGSADCTVAMALPA